MSAYWKIPKEWVNDWGLTATEALVLADALEWDCSQKERSERCNITDRQVRNITIKIAEKISSLDRKKFPLSEEIISALRGKNFRIERKKFPQKAEKISVPPITPLLKEKSQKEDMPAHVREEEAEKKSSKNDTKNDVQNEEKKLHEIILLGIVNFYAKKALTYVPDFAVETTAALEIAAKLKLVMSGRQMDTTPDKVSEYWTSLLGKFYAVADGWQKQHFDIKTINSQFNNLFNKISNGNNEHSAASRRTVTRPTGGYETDF